MKYLKNGQEVEVVSEFTGGFVVIPIYERDGHAFDGDQQVVKEVFDSPPMERIHKDVLEMQSKKESLRLQLNELRGEISKANAERNGLLEVIKQNPALRRIADFISGRFTHIVEEDYGRYRIIAVDSKEFKCDSAGRSYDREFKLITLKGRTNGDLGFKINQYSDGSGRSAECWLCQSEQEAKDLIVAKINSNLSSDSMYCLARHEESLKAYDLPVTREITVKLRASRLEAAAKAKVEAQMKLDQANKEWEALKLLAETPNS